jgi:hypothetical protein
MPKQICEINASIWFYCKEICYDAQSHELKKLKQIQMGIVEEIFQNSEFLDFVVGVRRYPSLWQVTLRHRVF